ncbi:MAG: biopolymer transporter ExbD [Parachlamydiales bacterium]|nr:biopolymer transporter ExbD [Parachlamydiales bacterium]
MRRHIRAAHTSSQEDVSINLTPLIDVVFVILIMFIVIAPMLEMDLVELATSGPNAKEISTTLQDKSPISIHVKSDNTVWFNRQKVTIPELEKLLSKAHEQFPKATPLLFQDKKARFGTYQTVKNCAENAGFTELDVLLSPS